MTINQHATIESRPNRGGFSHSTGGIMSTIPKEYRKKPVVIEALEYTGGNGYDVGLFVGESDRNAANQFLIHTLEGTMAADPGDFIIKGVNGEFYPCKPDIFAKTYESIEDAK